MSTESFEKVGTIREEIESIRIISERRRLLQEHWSELFGKIQNLDSKYPIDVQYDEQSRFRGDRSFYTSEDMEEYTLLNDGMESVDAERNELEQELLKRRFQLGLQYLEALNHQEHSPWKQTRRHEPNPKDPMDFLSLEEWRCVIGDLDARLEVVKEPHTSFINGARHIAEKTRDQELARRLDAWPQERDLPYGTVCLTFSVGPKSFFGLEEDLRPGLYAEKRFDSHDASRDAVDVRFPPLHTAYAFPTIEPQERERATTELVSLAHKLRIENF